MTHKPQHDPTSPSPADANPDTDCVEPRESGDELGTGIPPTTWDLLAEASARINLATEELSEAISAINLGLAKLNLGISVWCYLEPVHNDRDRIGYGRLIGRWGLLLSSGEAIWHFNHAPRWLRLEAVDSIPALLQKLTAEANDISGLIDAKMRRMRGQRR